MARRRSVAFCAKLDADACTRWHADQVAHDLYQPGSPLVQELAAAFGAQILDTQGGVNRRVLGDIVFRDPQKLVQLERIVHPLVRAKLIAIMRAMPENGIGALDAVEPSNPATDRSATGLVVVCPPEQQLQRLMQDRHMSAEDARARDPGPGAGGSLKRELATEIISNDGSLDDLRRQVSAAWQRFIASLPTTSA